MNRYSKYFCAIAVSLSLVVLAACGGGGGGPDNSTKTWGPAQSLQVSGTLEEAADIALNATGQGYAAWVEMAADGTSQLISQRYIDGQWQARTPIASATAAETLGAINLAVLPDGQAVAAWTKDTGIAKRVESARTQGDAWVPFATPIQEGIENIFDAKLASDGLGNAILVWKALVEGDSTSRIYATTVTKDGFKAVETISTGTLLVIGGSVELAVAANGDAIATWIVETSDPDTVQVRSYSGGQWTGTAPVALSSGLAFNSFSPHAAIGPNGTAIVVWGQRIAGGANRVAFSTTENVVTGPWQPMAILENDAFSASSPTVTRDPQGGTTIAWVSRGSGSDLRFDAWGQRLGTATAPGQKLETRDEGSATLDVRLSSDTNGGVVAVWVQDVDPDALVDNRQIFSNRFNPATAQWGQAEQLDPGSATGPGAINVLKLAMDATGRALVLRVHSTAAGVNTLVVNALR